MSTVKSQLEDLVLSVLNPSGFKEIESKVKSSERQRKKFIKKVIEPVSGDLKKYDIVPLIYGRAKSYASIYGKMIDRNKGFHEIYDLYAIRIIVERIEKSKRTGYRVVEPPMYLDFTLGNMCNLKCRLCQPQNSSQINKEYVKKKCKERDRLRVTAVNEFNNTNQMIILVLLY